MQKCKKKDAKKACGVYAMKQKIFVIMTYKNIKYNTLSVILRLKKLKKQLSCGKFKILF